MNKQSKKFVIEANQKQLHVFAVSFSGQEIPADIETIAQRAFESVVSGVKDEVQTAYVRDIPEFTIDGKYPGGACYNRHEITIAINDWDYEPSQLAASFHHELHHLARWQNVGYGDTLGGAILSEGIATVFEELQTGWTPPWASDDISAQNLSEALEEWDSKSYDHAQWFYGSERGKWEGYKIGYTIAKKHFGQNFDLQASLEFKPEDMKYLLEEMVAK